jgi:hypothetical protein
LPTWRSEAALATWETALARATAQGADLSQITRVFQSADEVVRADVLDARPGREVARQMMRLAAARQAPDGARNDWLDLGQRHAKGSAARCARDADTQRLLADGFTLRAEWAEARGTPEGELAFLREAAAHRDKAVSLYPSDPRGRIAAAQAWLRVWRVTGEATARTAVRDHLGVALRIDAARKADVAAKLTSAERAVAAMILGEIGESDD